MNKQCKNCVYGVFPIDEKTGGRKWQGHCYANTLSNQEGFLKYHTIMQHFLCSCNKFRPRNEAPVGQPGEGKA